MPEGPSIFILKELITPFLKKKKIIDQPSPNVLAKNLLSDIKKQKQRQLKSHFSKMLKEQTEKTFRQSLLNEPVKLQAAVERRSHGEVNKYKALILQAISEQWVIPPTANKRLTCELLIRLAIDGTVLQVDIVKSSGDRTLDSSARAAVFKASPLPVPAKKSEFEMFRHFSLKVKPENLLGADN